MRFLTVDDVLAIHDRLIEEGGPGNTPGVLNRGAIEAAVARHQHGPFPEPPDLAMRAALLLRGLAQDHPFLDGNKRTALASTTHFLRANDALLDADDEELVGFLLAVVGGHGAPWGVDEIGGWIRSRLRRV